jgi:hypothetical protein
MQSFVIDASHDTILAGQRGGTFHVMLSIKEISRAQLLDSFGEMKLDGIGLEVVTKKRMIVRKC